MCYWGQQKYVKNYNSCWGANACVKLYDFTIQSNITYSKGTTQYSNVTGTSSSAYPSNGRSGNYWYVYKGIY